MSLQALPLRKPSDLTDSHLLAADGSLLGPDYPLFASAAALFPFETAVGTNGVLWLRGSTIRQTIALGRALGAVDAGECRPEDVAVFMGKMELGGEEDEDESR